MNCEEFERELEELDDYSYASPDGEAHLRACVSCSELVEDLNSIRVQARQMLPLEEPSGRVWHQIQSQLKQEGVIAEPPRRALFGFGWLPRLNMAMAYSAVFFVAFGAVYVYSVLSPHVGPPPLLPGPNPPFAKLLEKVTPEKRAVYVNNLNQVDSSIQQLQIFLASHPDDQFARDELITTYQQKSRLWEDLVRWQDFSEAAPQSTLDTIPQALPASAKP
jgi:hypothetical protein